jgi:hypothetical protein
MSRCGTSALRAAKSLSIVEYDTEEEDDVDDDEEEATTMK